MKNKLLVLNMKMYMEPNDIKEFMAKTDKVDDNIIICPETIYIPYFINKYKNIGIQNIYFESRGAYTGCNSVLHAKKLGVNYAIVGHSECREYFNITDQIVNKQIKSIVDNNMIPIMCIGESLDDKVSSNSKKVIKKQIIDGLKGIKCDRIIIAYEPVYAIGTGNTLSKFDIIDSVNYIKEILNGIGINALLLYGGSVNSTNLSDLLTISVLDGFMVGKSSCSSVEVLKMMKLLSSN